MLEIRHEAVPESWVLWVDEWRFLKQSGDEGELASKHAVTTATISTVWKVGRAENRRIIASLVSPLSKMTEEHFTDCAEEENLPL